MRRQGSNVLPILHGIAVITVVMLLHRIVGQFTNRKLS
jgi:hypothetical protein